MKQDVWVACDLQMIRLLLLVESWLIGRQIVPKRVQITICLQKEREKYIHVQQVIDTMATSVVSGLSNQEQTFLQYQLEMPC